MELWGSSAVLIEQTQLSAEHAAEISEARATWTARARWRAAGKQWIAARVQFAVCTKDACVPQEQVVAVGLQVR